MRVDVLLRRKRPRLGSIPVNVHSEPLAAAA